MLFCKPSVESSKPGGTGSGVEQAMRPVAGKADLADVLAQDRMGLGRLAWCAIAATRNTCW